MKTVLFILNKTADILILCGRWCMRHRYWVLAGIVVFGFLLRLLRYSQELFLSRDAYGYILEVEKLAASGDWSVIFQQPAYANMPPGFFWLLWSGKTCGFDPVHVGLFWVFLAGIVLTLAVYWSIYGFCRQAGYALVATLIAATNPDLIRLGSTILRDVPYFACIMVAVGAGIWAVRKQQYRYWLIFIPAAAWAILLRKEGFEVLLMVLIWCAVSLPWLIWRREWRRVRFVGLSTVLTLGVLLVALLPLEFYFADHYHSQWEIIPHTWAGYVWTMFRSALMR